MTQESISRRQAVLAGSAACAGLVFSSAAGAAPGSSDPDPDITEMTERLLQVEGRGKSLTPLMKYCVLLAVTTTVAAPADAGLVAKKALAAGITPVQVKEAVYHCAAYVGLARVKAVLPAVNEAIVASGAKLPVESQKTVTDENRFEKGVAVQTQIFGDAITQMHKNAQPEDRAISVDDLSGWCFGDFYTRGGLDLKCREIVTFAAIAALGGCEPQLASHCVGNLAVGNTRQNLLDAIHIAVPYLGFPRTLNAVAIVKKNTPAPEK